MLTPIDVHYLVGVLVAASSPEKVKIELGGMVYDAAAEEERDVDVTATYVDAEGSVSAFAGIEVKAHTRPLDVTHVEQLAAKLSDMPAVSRRGIVSASGYTAGARRKAAARSVELFHLKTWDDTMGAFAHTKILPDAKFTDWNVEWHSVEAAHFVIPDGIDPEGYRNVTPRVCDAAGNSLPIPFQELRDRLLHESLKAFFGTPDHRVRVADQPYPVEGVVKVNGGIFLDLGDAKVPADQMQVRGEIVWKKTVHDPVLKVLIRDGEDKPYVGGLVGIANSGDIFCVTTSNPTRSIQVYKVSLTDREKNKVYRREGFQPQPFEIAPLDERG